MNVYYSKQGDTLDLICHHYYGRQSGALEQVLVHNPNLARLDVLLPVGTRIVLPAIEIDSEQTTALW